MGRHLSFTKVRRIIKMAPPVLCWGWWEKDSAAAAVRLGLMWVLMGDRLQKIGF